MFEVAATAMERLETPRDRVSLYDKKYTVVFGDDHWKSGDVLRYGEPWRKLDGDPALFDFARDAESAQRHA
ncbi:hypothetical protein, partial [Stenotrophomonas maltophilia]|uniref:hypothetical protein n=1 Tax=Stenotrophomonas maltophilia TaxID=40324 RepID=UPI0013DBC176